MGMLYLVSGAVFAGSYSIDAADWQQPRSAAMVKSLPGVQAAIRELLESDTRHLLIRHEDDEEGALWGAELRDWLVSLGIPPARIALAPGAVTPAALNIEVQAMAGQAS